jgi:hypothetical protein
LLQRVIRNLASEDEAASAEEASNERQLTRATT